MLCGPRKEPTSMAHNLYLGGDFIQTKNILAGSATMITHADADADAARERRSLVWQEENMAKISIDIDTDSTAVQSATHGLRVAGGSPSQVGLLSSIAVTTDMLTQFSLGLGGTPQVQDQATYVATAIQGKKDILKANCKVIAAIGGSIVFQALAPVLQANMPPFVSLVGSVPAANFGNCRGGISLESWASDSLRKDYLKGMGFTDNNIYLYTNLNSAMHAAESGAWGIAATFIESYVGDGHGNNDSTKFVVDFNGAPGYPTKIPGANNAAIIVSDDPFFQANQQILVPLLNTWVSAAGTNRWVVYPSQVWTGSQANRTTIVGPDLLRAYMLLGALAGSLLANINVSPPVNFGFIKLASDIIPVV
jgi:hypothetical protein